MGLVTLDKVKAYVGETTTDNDQFLQDQIDIMSEAVEGYCARKFESASYTQIFEGQAYDPANLNKITSFHYPILTVTSVKEIDPSSGDETIVTDYKLETSTGFFRRTSQGNYRQSWFAIYGLNSQVEIQYDAGYTVVPLPIQDVVCSLVAQRYSKMIAGVDISFGDDVQRMSIPGVMSIDFDYTLQANERTVRFGMILGNYVNVLDHYRSERVIIGGSGEVYVS